mmetsp:Transcript_13047/g.28601  ORF Transcript_13047/g.28601 Transcript_13047/m.28601 type:complete len:184 (-) Transcript_13047:408-959(-)
MIHVPTVQQPLGATIWSGWNLWPTPPRVRRPPAAATQLQSRLVQSRLVVIGDKALEYCSLPRWSGLVLFATGEPRGDSSRPTRSRYLGHGAFSFSQEYLTIVDISNSVLPTAINMHVNLLLELQGVEDHSSPSQVERDPQSCFGGLLWTGEHCHPASVNFMAPQTRKSTRHLRVLMNCRQFLD